MSMCSHCLEIYERKKLMLCIAVRNASEKTGTVAITETGVTSIVLITLSSLSFFEDVGMILLELTYQNLCRRWPDHRDWCKRHPPMLGYLSDFVGE